MNLDKFCQSCMMPKDSDMFTASTEKDGSVNGEYCSYCYDAGEFNMSDSIKTASDMQEMVKKQLKKQGIGKVKRWFYTIGIPKLGRWKKR
jgi:radical SAM superfamily enzyme